MNRFSLAVVTAIASAVLLLDGCSAASEITNKGGDTTCKEFNGQDEEKQRSEVSKMLKDQNGNDPSNMEISAMRAAANVYCKTLGKEDSKISNAKL